VSKGKSAAVIVSLLFVVGLFVGYRITNQSEPSYQGKSVSAWLDNSNAASERMEALKAVGTNAAPYIIRRLRNVDSPWRAKYGEFFQRLPGWLARVLPQPSTYDYYSGAGAFCDTGPTVKPLLIKALKDRSGSVRTASACALFMLYQEGFTNITDALPSLTESLLDKDEGVQFYATMAIDSIGSDAYSAVPELITVLETKTNSFPLMTFYARSMEIRALGHIGSRAKSALPCLKVLLENKDLKVEAALAMWRIDTELSNTLPILIEGFNREREPSLDVIDGLGEIGPAAKSAVPRMKDLMGGPNISLTRQLRSGELREM
jgi:hypothetical protein